MVVRYRGIRRRLHNCPGPATAGLTYSLAVAGHNRRADPAIHLGELPIAHGYRRFARREAHGVSAVYEIWASQVADDEAIWTATVISDSRPY